MKAYQNTTLARVTFYTFEHGIIPAFDGDGFTPLVGFTTSKRLGDVAGSWSVTLKGHIRGGAHDGDPWPDFVTAGDWTAIDVWKNGVLYGVLLGVVDNVEVAIDPGQTGEGAVSVTISGRDAGASLADTPVYFNPWDSLHANAAGIDMERLVNSNIGLKPHEFIRKVVQGFFSAEGLYGGLAKVPPGLAGPTETPWIDFMDLTSAMQSVLRGAVIPGPMIGPDGAPSVWQFLETYRNPPLNEMFVDTTIAGTAVAPFTSRRAYLVLRERPYVNIHDGLDSPWFDLPAAEIPSDTVHSASLSRGFASYVNHFWLIGDLLPGLMDDKMSLYPPLVKKEEIERFGLHRLEERSRYVDLSQGAFEARYREWADIMLSWHSLNHKYWSGRLVLGEMRPEIRVGWKVYLTHGPLAHYRAFPRDEGVRTAAMSFYVEGVQHTYSEGESPVASTQLMVSRGYPEGSRLADKIVEHFKFEGVSLTPGTSSNRGDLDGLGDFPVAPSTSDGIEQA